MILTNTVENEAILSNVGEIGEFRIRNSAKAFNILSSGLYSNKIKAIIRELSCNAYDSHVAAGKKEVPFDVHLPSNLEPWFSVRDYGVGLNHNQVVNIYTTYFESTKTSSNEFIGALGLGSKSPFSYTDNFIVTAIKDGRKGIYTAFVNDQGIPSIALMSETSTDEPTGVEIKFSVNKPYDFQDFKREAIHVYQYFKTIPNAVIYDTKVDIPAISYETRDIIPGVHSYNFGSKSMAVMGNIAYPIEIENMGQKLDRKYYYLLESNLELNFEIGELDFQASREGLSYIPMTISAIKNKLDEVYDELYKTLENQISEISNLWDQAFFIQRKANTYLWGKFVKDYVNKVPHPFFHSNYGNLIEPGQRHNNLSISDEDLKNWNIEFTALYATNRSLRPYRIREDEKKLSYIHAQEGIRFCIHNKRLSYTKAIQSHFPDLGDKKFYVLRPLDKKLPMNTDAFFKAIHNPPDNLIVDLKDVEIVSDGVERQKKKVSVLKLNPSASSKEKNWHPVGNLDSFDDSCTYYYIPVNNQEIINEKGISLRYLRDFIYRSGLFDQGISVYGIRKNDLKTVSQLKNWVHVDQLISDRISNLTEEEMVKYALAKVDSSKIFSYNYSAVKNTNSPIVRYVSDFKNKSSSKRSEMIIIVQNCCKIYNSNVLEKFNKTIKSVESSRNDIFNRYPMLSHIWNSVPNDVIIDYVNMVDTHKGV